MMITHVVVAAARHLEPASASATIAQWLADVLGRRLLPPRPRSLVLFVDNASPPPAARALRDACARASAAGPIEVRYVRNQDWADGFGFELGAWRWALRHSLGKTTTTTTSSSSSGGGEGGADDAELSIATDALLYLTQDSLRLWRPALPYPPPRSFTAAPLLSFASGGGAIQGVTPDEAASQWRAAAAALRRVERATPFLPGRRYTGAFGPSLLTTVANGKALLARGLFDMLRVQSKVDEQLSERLLGWFVTHDLHQPCSVGGDYYLNFVLPKSLGRLDPADRAFAKDFRNRSET